MKRKNVLIIYTDQQRVDTLRCYGNKQAISPNIDQLANDGITFKQYYVQNPVCMASRMSFLTGCYPSFLGIGCNGTPLPEDVITLNKLFKPYGYHTGNIGKLHFQPHSKRDHRNSHPTYGFDTFILSDEPGCYDDAYSKWVELKGGNLEGTRVSLPPAAKIYGKPEYSTIPRETHEPYILKSDKFTHSAFVTEEVCTYIDNHKHEPFLAIAGFYAPHPPVNPPQKYYDMYKNIDFNKPILGKNEQVSNQLKDVSEEEWKDIRRHYMALSSHLDDCIGVIINKLKKENIYDDTIIIFTSDHGEYLGDHGRIQKGMPGHDCITNVPCIIKYASDKYKGLVVDGLIEAVDIVPTLLDWCGIQIPDFIQGKSVSRYIETLEKHHNKMNVELPVHKNSVLVDYFEPIQYQIGKSITRSTTIRTDSYMYNVDGYNEILYDIKNDPLQLNNLAEDMMYQKVKSELRLLMIRRIQESGFVNRFRPEMY